MPKERTEPAVEGRGFSWKRYLIQGAIVVVLLVVAYIFAITVLPRWWAQRVGDQVGGKFGAGWAWGLFYGVVFTFVPLVVARQAIRKLGWTLRVVFLAIAVVLATPNLLTLGIVLGTGNAAHAGERILDVSAPAFRAASLVGAIVATVLALGVFGLLAVNGRNRRQVKELRGEQKERELAAKQRAEQDEAAEQPRD